MRENGKNSTRHIKILFSIFVLAFVVATGTCGPNLNGVVAYAKTKKENPKISKKRKNLKRKKSFTLKVAGTKDPLLPRDRGRFDEDDRSNESVGESGRVRKGQVR